MTVEVPFWVTSRTWRLLPVLAVLAGALGAAAGCRQRELAEQRLVLRAARMARTVDMAAKHERSRPRRLARTLNVAQWRVARDAEASRENVDEIKLYWQRRWQRWLERQPVYQEEARRLLLRKPGTVERTAIMLFF